MKSVKSVANSNIPITENVIQGPVKLVLRLSRIFGIAPVQLTSKGAIVSRVLIVYSRVLIIIFNISILAGLLVDMLAEENRSMRLVSPVDSVMWFTNVCVVIIFVSDGAYNAPWRTTCMIEMLQSVNKIKSKFGYTKETLLGNNKTCIIIVLVMFSVLFLLILDFIKFYWIGVDDNKELLCLYLYAAFYVEYLIVILLEIQLILLIHIPYTGLRAINASLQQLLDDFQEQSKWLRKDYHSGTIFVIPRTVPAQLNLIIDTLVPDEKNGLTDGEVLSQKISEQLRTLSQSYLEMCMMVRNVNKRNGPILLVMLLMTFLDLMINLYYWIMSILNNEHHSPGIALETAWCVYHAINTVVLLEPCHKTQFEIEQTRTLVSLLTNRFSNDKFISTELDKFLVHLVLNNPSYSPMGMCVISRSFITAIISAVATYLVVIVEFQLTE